GIESKYSKLIRTNTLFWRKEAIKADIGLLGADISVGSLEQIMKGGIELATPNEMGELAKAGAEFTLSEEAPKEVKQWNPKLL
ncbi:MAG: MCE family protein, partial [Pseudobdellovibrio sp.]